MNSSKTVLVVDDSRVSRLMTRQFILSKHASWRVEEAATGEEALKKIGGMSPVLILIDVNMPGMGGLPAAGKLRLACPGAHVSLLTANIQNTVRDQAAALGVGFVGKPVTQARVHRLIEAIEGQPCST